MRDGFVLTARMLLPALIGFVPQASADESVETETTASLEARSATGDAASPAGSKADEGPPPGVRLPRFAPPDRSAAKLTVAAGTRFVPADRGAPMITVAAGTRGGPAPGAIWIDALVPQQVGLTLEEQPALYWYLSQGTASGVELLVTREQTSTPVLAASIGGPLKPGVQRIQLSDHGLHLKPGAAYRWRVTLIPNPKRAWEKIVTEGEIERIDPAPALQSELAGAEPAQACFILAEAGIWYDALAALSRRIDAAPDDETARWQRAALLEQVGLSTVAAVDRSAARRAGQEEP